MDEKSNVLQSTKVKNIIKALGEKVSKESQRKEGKGHEVKFDSIGTADSPKPEATKQHDPVDGGQFKGYVNPITGSGTGPQNAPHVEDTL